MKLFYDDEFDAIRQAISDSGKPFKLVAAHMFPDMKPDEAVKLVEAINSAANTMERAMKALDHIKSRGGIRAVA